MSPEPDPRAARWAAVVQDGGLSLVQKCLNLAKIVEYPEMDVGRYAKRIDGLGITLKEAVGGTENPTYLISMLNEHLFDNFGLSGDEDDYYNPGNNLLNVVLDKRSGLPVAVSVIYVQVASHVGLDLRIVGFPGHVLVKLGETMIIDPFYGGRILGAEDLQQMLNAGFGEGEVRFVPEFLDAISHRQTLARMTRNLKNSYMQSYAFERAGICMDLAAVLEKNVPEEDVRDRGIVEERLGRYRNALSHLNRYLQISPNAEDADFVLGLIRRTRAKVSL